MYEENGEFLRGAGLIAEFMTGELNEPVRKEQVYAWVSQGHLKVGRWAGKFIARKSDIHAQLSQCSTLAS